MNRKQRRAAAAIARRSKRKVAHEPSLKVNAMGGIGIAELKAQIVSLEREQQAAIETYQQTAGALKLARHQLARLEAAAAKAPAAPGAAVDIAAEAAKAREAVAKVQEPQTPAVEDRDAPTIPTD